MQDNVNQGFQQSPIQERSLGHLIIDIRFLLKYLLSKWVIILAFGILGAALGLTYSIIKDPTYTATTSFVLEAGTRGNPLSAYANIASTFGVDLGGAGGGIFEGENILELYKSRKMLSRTLLSEGEFNGKKQLLIDRYIEFNNLRERWIDEPKMKAIRFNKNNVYTTSQSQILHDSLMSNIVKVIKKNYLNVTKIDKKLNIVEVELTFKDELFAKYFNENLVRNVNNFYLDTKSKKSLENVAILQYKTDSVRNLLSGSIYRAAAVADATPNQNPARMTQRIAPIQNLTANAEINKEVLGTLLQNLELSKIALSKETPLIQIVDEPILPLEKNKVRKLIAVIVGGLLGGIIILMLLISRRYIKNALAATKFSRLNEPARY